MKVSDIEQVNEIERQSFTMPWSALTYVYEIRQNHHAHMGVLELPNQPPPQTGYRPFERLQVLFRPLTKSAPINHTLVAYGGMWFRDGEAHVSTIASHPDYRGRQLGELMLQGLVFKGLALEADRLVLEVRVSNTVAQRLYRKYGFEITNRIANYYRDNHEDAYIMTVSPIDTAYRARLQENLDTLRGRLAFSDSFTGLEINTFNPDAES